MNKSDEIKDLATALAAAQGELENASKNAQNPHFRSKYADLAEIINCIRPVFSKHGLATMQCPSFSDGVASVETVLMHKSGQWMSSNVSAPVGKQDAQGVGSAITYLRRYSLAAVANLAQEDDDANTAVGRGKQRTEVETISKDQIADLEALAQEVGADIEKFTGFLKIRKLDDLPKSQYQAAVKALEHKRSAA